MWVVVGAFAALPLAFCELDLSPAEAVFESVSGITTTGATVIVGLDVAPPGILLWRAILHWLGGIGFIVMAVAILPMLRVGGMQLVRTESSDLSEKILPRAAQVASAIGLIYLGLTVVCAHALLHRRHDAVRRRGARHGHALDRRLLDARRLDRRASQARPSKPSRSSS